MTVDSFTLTGNEAAYVVAALRIALDHMPEPGTPAQIRDREAMAGIMFRLAAPMDLSDDVLVRLDRDRGQQ
jgi:hypothetical protein